MHHSTPHQLIQAGLWKLGWSIAIVTAIAYFIRSILMYINEDRIAKNLNEGIFLVTFFCVVIILLTIFLQQCNFISARLGIKIQVHLSCKLVYFRRRPSALTGTQSFFHVCPSEASALLLVSEDLR